MRRSLRLSKRKTDVVPLDLQIEILNRLPAKSVVRFVLVSKSWGQIIGSKRFIRSFPSRSLTQPLRFLISLIEIDDQTRRLTCKFFSTSSALSSTSTISTSFLSRITLPSPNGRLSLYPAYYVNGLVNIGQTICNPCTGKYITLPRLVKKTMRLFGYDPINHQYKVLCMSPNLAGQGPALWSNFHVFTLGAKPKSWRLIDCSIPHSPLSSEGLCIDGFMYYIAETDTEVMSVMRFDLKSEKFDIFARVSEDFRALWSQGFLSLINYHGKVGAAIQPFSDLSSIELFVFEAGKQDFKERSFHNLPKILLRMKGISHTGDIIFAPNISKEASVIRQDPKGASFKKMNIELDANPDSFCGLNYLLGYVESLMLL